VAEYIQLHEKQTGERGTAVRSARPSAPCSTARARRPGLDPPRS
jgi:hypothetical protein